MFSADPFSNIPFCGSTLYGSPPIPIPPFVKRDIHREVLYLCAPKLVLKLNAPSRADRIVITLKITDLNLNLNRK